MKSYKASEFHEPVLLKQVLKYLKVRRGYMYVDATVGGGGHAGAICEMGGRVIGIDQDPEAITAAKKHLKSVCPVASWQLTRGNFSRLADLVKPLTEEAISGVLFDLGVSSYQLSGHKRGFSFNTDELLDMRMDPDNQAVTAKELIAALYEKELHELFKKYADENLAGPIARRLVVARREQPITTTGQLRDLVAEVYKRYGVHHKTDPATKVFQALRIAVNDELNNLTFGLKAAWQILRHQGHLVVITFHSGEDRIVKQQFKQWVASNEGSIITKKPLLGKEEKSLNPRSRSAKLRAIVKNDS